MKYKKEAAPKIKKILRLRMNQVVFNEIQWTGLNHIQAIGRGQREPQHPVVYIVDYNQRIKL